MQRGRESFEKTSETAGMERVVRIHFAGMRYDARASRQRTGRRGTAFAGNLP